MAEVPTSGTLGGLPVAGLSDYGSGVPNSPQLKAGNVLSGTTGPSSKARVVPVGGYDYRRRIATIRASHAARAAAGEGLAVAEKRYPNPTAKPLATPERPVVMGAREAPLAIAQPFSLRSAPVIIDSRLLQPPPTAGYAPVKFF